MSTINERLISYVESSFLAPLLKEEAITDVSYNGKDLFYENRKLGRKKSKIRPSLGDVSDFLRQIANFSEKQFSFRSPILDVSFGRYRLNAVFHSIARVKDEKVFTFAMRIGKEGTAIKEKDPAFWGDSQSLLLSALEGGESILIAGETGAGKTELQKYLISHLRPNTRVIVIDNVGELELSRGDDDLDMTSWLVDERNENASFDVLIRNALRNNPDYLLVAESRGKEMLDALNCVMAGHPIITTLHAKDIYAVPSRIARMAMQSGQRLSFDDLLADIYHHFSVVVYLKKIVSPKGVIRYIDQVGRLNEAKRKVDLVYQRKGGTHEEKED